MILAVTLRVKNSILFIEEWIKCYERIADIILVVDNGSTDGTYELLKMCSKVKKIQRTEGFDEGRDNFLLLKMLNEFKPDWILSVDSDEIIEEALTRRKIERLMNNKYVNHYRFVLFNLFNDRSHFLAENFLIIAMMKGYGRSLYRYNEDLFVPNRNIHVSISGKPFFYIPTIYRIKHLCFINREYRLEVYENYMKIDGDNKKHTVWYKRDVELLLNPHKARVFRYSNKLIYRLRDYLLFNMLYPLRIIKGLMIKLIDKFKL